MLAMSYVTHMTVECGDTARDQYSVARRGGGGGGLQPPHWHVNQNAE